MKDNKNIDKTYGILRKITLNNKDLSLKTEHKEFCFELNLYEMTFSYREKNERSIKRSYGYKQVHKYTLHLTREEESSNISKTKLAFKIYLENKTFLVFCRTVFDMRTWIEAFKKFFDKKSTIMNFLQQKIQRENVIKQKLYIEKWKYLDKFVMNSSESFSYNDNNSNNSIFQQQKIRKNKTNSVDKIYTKHKTSYDLKHNKNQPSLYTSKLVRVLTSEKIPLNIMTKKIKTQPGKLQNFLLRIINKFDEHFKQCELKQLIKKLKLFYKPYRDYKMIEYFEVTKKKMEEEWEFYMNASSNNHNNMNKKENKEGLKSQVMLLGENNSKLNINDDKQESDDGSDFDKFLEKIPNKKHQVINQNDKGFIIPSLNENFQNVEKRNLDNENKYYENIKQQIRINQEIVEMTHNNTVKNRIKNSSLNELQVTDKSKVIFKPETNYFIYEYKNSKDTPNEEVKRTKTNKESSTTTFQNFPKGFRGNYEQNYFEDIVYEGGSYTNPKDIDTHHMKGNGLADLVISVSDGDGGNEEEDEIDNNIGKMITPTKRHLSGIDSPHFGNISIIAQRYNKIDNIDDWKEYVSK